MKESGQRILIVNEPPFSLKMCRSVQLVGCSEQHERLAGISTLETNPHSLAQNTEEQDGNVHAWQAGFPGGGCHHRRGLWCDPAFRVICVKAAAGSFAARSYQALAEKKAYCLPGLGHSSSKAGPQPSHAGNRLSDCLLKNDFFGRSMGAPEKNSFL
jgi:hypothetical protein